MANTSYTLRVQESGKLSYKELITRRGKNFEPLKLVGTKNTTYVLTDVQDNPVTTMVVKQKNGDLLVYLADSDTNGVPDLVIQNYADVQSSAAFGTKTAQGFSEFTPSSWFGTSDLSSGATQSCKADDGISLLGSVYKSPWFFPVGVVVAAGVASAAKKSTTNTNTSDATAIFTYAADTTGKVSAPDVYAYSDAKITGVTSTNVALVNSGVKNVKADTVDKINTVIAAATKIVDKANGTSADTTTNDPVLADYQALKINLSGADTNTTQLALLTDIIKNRVASEVSTVAQIGALASIADKLMSNAKDQTPATQLTAPELVSIGLTDITNTNVGGYLSAVRATANDGSGIATLEKLKTISASYLKIFNLANANRGDADASKVPTVSDYATAGVTLPDNVKNDANALKVLNDTLDGFASSSKAISKVAKATSTDADFTLTDLATALGKVLQVRAASDSASALAVGLTLQDLNGLLGATTVTNGNLNEVVSAIWGNKGDPLDSYAKLLAAVDVGVVMNYADTLPSDATHVAPTLQQYQDIGLAKLDNSTDKAVTTSNYLALNSAVEALASGDVNTKDKIQTVLNTYVKIMNLADPAGTKATDPLSVPSLADYTAIGALKNYDATTGAIGGTSTSKAAGSGQQHVAALTLLNSVVDNLTSTSSIDTIAEINKIAIAADKVLDLAANASTSSTSTLSATDLTTLGLTGVAAASNATWLPQLKTNINGTSSADGTAVDTVSELQALVSLATVQTYAGDPTQTAPTLQNYKDLNFTDITWNSTLQSAVTSALPSASAAVTGGSSGTLHALSLSYQSILKEVGGLSTDANPTATDYFNVLGKSHLLNDASGVTGLVAANVLDLMNDVVRHLNLPTSSGAAGVSTKTSLETMASSVDNLMKALGTSGSNITWTDLRVLGLNPNGYTTSSGVNDRLALVNTKLHTFSASGADINTWDEIYNVLNNSSIIL